MKKIKETDCKVLRTTGQQLEFLRKETKKVFPIEACALLFGRVAKKEIVVERIVPMPNILKSADEYKIDLETVGAALNEIEPKLIGFFHSHPLLPIPSSKDIEYMRLWGESYIWLILSTLDFESFAAFQIKDGKPQRLTMINEP